MTRSSFAALNGYALAIGHLDQECRRQWVNHWGSIADDAPECAERVIAALVEAREKLDECLKLVKELP